MICTTTHVDVHVRGRTCARVDVPGRMSLQLHSIMLTMLILRDTARYCVKLQQKSRNTTHISSRPRFVREGTCVHVRGRTCVRVCVRARAQCE